MSALNRAQDALAREAGIPLHQALDRVARREGLNGWSHLAAAAAHGRPARQIVTALHPGDLVLVGARPGHGKTLLGLEMCAEAALTGRAAAVFTLEETEADTMRHLRSLVHDPRQFRQRLAIDTSEAIAADHIVTRLSQAPGAAFALVDHLQLLDQSRRKPDLAVQVRALRAFAEASGAIIVVLAQIDRRFDATVKPLPDLADLRLPNPVDLSCFTKSCFLHAGVIALNQHGG